MRRCMQLFLVSIFLFIPAANANANFVDVVAKIKPSVVGIGVTYSY